MAADDGIEHSHPRASGFSIARGGPFFAIMQTLGLVRASHLHRKSRAFFFVSFTWLIPLLLAAVEGHAATVPGGVSYLADAGVWAKFLLAIWLFTIAERGIDHKLASCVSELFSVPIIPARSFLVGNQAIARAAARRDALFPELICLLLALAFSVTNYANILHLQSVSWAVGSDMGLSRLTLAGWWTFCISNTVFWFLLLRIFWWHANWTLLMHDLAKLPLRLVATHPDGYGGIGFLSDYPNGYIAFNVGLSSVVAAALAREAHIAASAPAFGVVAGIWLLLALAFFAVPLIGFGQRLTRLKRLTLHEASIKATEFERQTERKLFGHNLFAENDESNGGDPVSDPAKFYSASVKRPSMIAARATLIPVIAATLLPLAAVGATEFPFSELLPIIKRLLFL